MKFYTRQRGIWGENLALSYLIKQGYSLIARNYQTRFGEIDLIVKDDTYVVFVEVKVRKDMSFAYASEYVDYKKQKKIQTTAKLWLMSKKSNLQPRFDVIEIYTYGDIGEPEINHIENAF